MDLLFKEGSSYNAYPLKLVYLPTPVDLLFPAQAMFVAPKRNFKKSPDRNLLKRRMREAYRVRKNKLYELLVADDKKMLIAFIYTSRKEEAFDAIEKAMEKLIAVLNRKKEA